MNGTTVFGGSGRARGGRGRGGAVAKHGCGQVRGEHRLLGQANAASLCAALTEKRSGLVVGTRLTQATGVAEHAPATALTEAVPTGTGYDTAGFVAGLRAHERDAACRPEPLIRHRPSS
jgi:hypothetical protein